MLIFDIVIIGAYFLVPITLIIFLRRFRQVLLEDLRSELHWFALLTFAGGVDHLLTALKWLPDNLVLKGALAAVLATSAGQMVYSKVRLARHLEAIEQEKSRSDARAASAEKDTAVATEAQAKAESQQKDFMAYLLHELRNPMQTIVSMTDVLVRTIMTTIQINAVQTVLESVNLMKQLANDVLDISKIEAGKLVLEKVSFDLRQCIRTGVHGFVHVATTKKLDFQQELASDLPLRIFSDPTRFHQIFLNLLSNAFKFTTRGSVIVNVQVEDGNLKDKQKEDEKDEKQMGEKDNPKAQESKEKQQKPAKATPVIVLRVEVSDTGIGMTPPEVDRLFVPYSQAKLATFREYGGTGLGLAITKRLVELMDGTLSVESEIGKGTSMTARIPVVTDGEVRPPSPSPSPPASILKGVAETHTLMVVDDNLIIRKMIGTSLEVLGFVVKYAEDGPQTIALLESGLKPSLIFMDVSMPGMDGYQTTIAIRKLGFTGPIVAVTAMSPVEEAEKVKQSGMNHIVSKPVSRNDLVRIIVRFIPSTKTDLSTAPIATEAGRALA